MKRTRPWELSDEVWERVKPLIPERPPHPKGGRPAEEDRQMLSAILYVLRTGIQWNALPRELGASTTVYDRFRLWEAQGVFERIWQAGLQEYDELEGIAWEWQSLDGVMTKSFTSRFFIKPPPEPHELWSWCSSFWEPRASLATVPAQSAPPSIHHLESASRRW